MTVKRKGTKKTTDIYAYIIYTYTHIHMYVWIQYSLKKMYYFHVWKAIIIITINDHRDLTIYLLPQYITQVLQKSKNMLIIHLNDKLVLDLIKLTTSSKDNQTGSKCFPITLRLQDRLHKRRIDESKRSRQIFLEKCIFIKILHILHKNF